MLEKDIQRQIIKYLEQELNAYVVKTIATNKRGTPDILACVNGRFVAIEVKRPGCKPTPLQLLTLERIRERGGLAIWADNLKIIKELLRNK